MQTEFLLTLAGQDESLPGWVRNLCDQVKLEFWQHKDATMTAAKTNAERQREYRARQAQQNQTEVRGIFAHPDDHQAVKDEAAKINRRRQRAQKRAAP